MGVILTIDRVGSGDDTTSGVERCMDTCFGNGDGLLFHDFVNGNAIDIAHFVEFIDADYTTISQDHGAGFEPSLSCLFV